VHPRHNIAGSLITPLRFFPPLFEECKMISYYRAGYNGGTPTPQKAAT
jgi:hypothetical protein